MRHRTVGGGGGANVLGSVLACFKLREEDHTMAMCTPNARNHEGLAALASRYVDVASLPWTPTRFKGVDMKGLMEDKETGLSTALVRFAPGATLPTMRTLRRRHAAAAAARDHA